MLPFWSVLVVFLLTIESAWFILAIKRKKSSPALSSWLIWFAATALSATSYVLSRREQLLSGIIILGDAASLVAIVISILLWGDRTLRFRRFEKWYLLGCAVIVCYGLVSRDAFQSNLYTQALIATGYLPTYHKLIKEKRNTEAYGPWLITFFHCFVGIIPAVIGADLLAIIYISRGGLQIILLLSLMLFYDFLARRARAKPQAHP